MAGSLKDAFETTNGATGASKTADAISVFTLVLLFALIVGVPVWYVFDIDFLKVLAVALALAASFSLQPVLGESWLGTPLAMVVLGLVVAVPVWLVFRTGFFTVIVVSLVLGILGELLSRKELRETQEQEERSYRPNLQGGDGERTVPVRSRKLRAMPYEEYLRTPHWKRKREDKLRAAGHRCQVCNSGSGILDVHHRTYERLGEELDMDLTVLCRGCHRRHHESRRLTR